MRYKTINYNAIYNLLTHSSNTDKHNINDITDIIVTTFNSFNVYCNVDDITQNNNYVFYHVNFDVSKISKLKNIMKILSLITNTHVEHTDSNISLIKIAILKKNRDIIYFGDIVKNNKKMYKIALGLDENNNTFILDFAKTPHLLIGGATGSGKSVLMHNIICNLIINNTPETAELAFIDLKQVEFKYYFVIPHSTLYTATTLEQAISVFNHYIKIMYDRYNRMLSQGLNNVIGNINYKPIYIFVDELGDLMLQNKKVVEPLIVKLAQLGRASNIHLILATQRPTVNIVTGLIKANLTTRIALKTMSKRDSLNILDVSNGADLLGNGDGYMITSTNPIPSRFQASYIPIENVYSIINYQVELEKALNE